MRVLFASAEVAPFSKVGGLADVAGSLPKALAGLGHEVKVVTPLHGVVRKGGHTLQPVAPGVEHRLPHQGQVFSLQEAGSQNGVRVYFVENPRFFDRPSVYEQPDDLERFLFFCQSVLEVPKMLNWQPDIVHLNDWHTAPVAALLAHQQGQDRFYTGAASVLTIHNIQYQGSFAQSWQDQVLPFVAVPPSTPHTCLALGVCYAHFVNTVSTTYAHEALTPEYGYGLEHLLASRDGNFLGILNGIDYQEYDPARDRHLVQQYDASTLEKRAVNKAVLQRKAGLPERQGVPLVAMVTRLVDQKGIDLLEQTLEPWLQELDFQFVLLGSGDRRYHDFFATLARRYPEKAVAYLGFDGALAQKIYGGCDVFLMPSRFEPCGLGQMIAMRYGAVPLVRNTGGLADTVEDVGPGLSSGTGFVFHKYSAQELDATMRRAIGAFGMKDAWRGLQRRCMAKDFSWGASARQYEAMYQEALRVAE